MSATNAGRIIDYRVQRALARAISSVENRTASIAQAEAAFANAHPPREGVPAYVLGVTGPPGAGKSTLVDKLIGRFRANGETVCVIAIDPSSPFTHGAVLGDRVRMQQHSGDAGVFIRSMASREAGGGLAPTTDAAISLARLAGFDVIIVETVGVGQVELEIVSVADTVVVVTVPALGDGVQTIKAGMTEIADVFVVNMADRPGANQTALDLVHMCHESGRDVQVLQTVASVGQGIDELMGALAILRAAPESNAERTVRFGVVRTIRDLAVRDALDALDGTYASTIFEQLASRAITREQATRALVAHLRGE